MNVNDMKLNKLKLRFQEKHDIFYKLCMQIISRNSGSSFCILSAAGHSGILHVCEVDNHRSSTTISTW